MKLRELVDKYGLDTELMVRFDETEDEVNIHPLDWASVKLDGQRLVIDSNYYFHDIFGADSDQ